MLIYPLVWHLLHQYVLHSRWMWKSKLLSPTWKRIHYDHHQDPNDLSVLFGALHTTLPTIAAATMPIGWLIGGFGGAMAAFATGLLTTCYYEFMHCIQHLGVQAASGHWVQHMKQRHMEHHFFDEDGNFGITNYFWDRALGTYYEKKDRPKRSATVFNLGYDEEVAKVYPWVEELSRRHRQRPSAPPRARARKAPTGLMPIDPPRAELSARRGYRPRAAQGALGYSGGTMSGHFGRAGRGQARFRRVRRPRLPAQQATTPTGCRRCAPKWSSC